MIRSVLVLLMVALFASGCGKEPPDGNASSRASEPADSSASMDNSSVEAFLTEYYDALSDRDWPRFADRFHSGAHIAFVMPDSTGSVAGVTFQSVPDFVALAPLGPGSREIFEERMTGSLIHISGDLAAWVHYEARFGDPGEIMEWSGTDAITLIRIGDIWRITSLTYVPEL